MIESTTSGDSTASSDNESYLESSTPGIFSSKEESVEREMELSMNRLSINANGQDDESSLPPYARCSQVLDELSNTKARKIVRSLLSQYDHFWFRMSLQGLREHAISGQSNPKRQQSQSSDPNITNYNRRLRDLSRQFKSAGNVDDRDAILSKRKALLNEKFVYKSTG